MKIESKIGQVKRPAAVIYSNISDFRNFSNIIPQDKVSNWQASEEKCSFSIDMLGNLELVILEKEPAKLVKIISSPEKSSQNLTLWIQIKELAENDSRIKITIEPKINKMMLAMAKKPLKSFVDTLVDKIEEFPFNEAS